MSDPLPVNSHSLARLMKLDDGPPAWNAAELSAILAHQLAAPLEYDLRTIAPGGEQTVSAMTEAITLGPRPHTFGDLIGHPRPPLDLLRLMKDFARANRDNGSLPMEVGTLMYFAALTLALVRHDARITSLEDRELRKGLDWAQTQGWVSQDLRRMFSEGIRKLQS